MGGFELFNWTMTGFPFEDYTKIQEIIDENVTIDHSNVNMKLGPVLFHGEFNISEERIFDTYLNPNGWGKVFRIRFHKFVSFIRFFYSQGLVFINGFNLGRYWPLSGPQITLYVPKEVLKQGKNQITLLELQKFSKQLTVEFTDKPNLDGI